MGRMPYALFYLCFLLPFALGAQNQQSGQPAATPVFRVTAHQVQVHVLVHDKQGRPVANLTKDDFTIYDKGQPQQIRYFAVETSGAMSEPAPALPPGFVSNRLGSDPERHDVVPRSLTAVLMDGAGTPTRDQIAWKRGMVKFLQQLQPGDRVAIYALTDTLHVLHDFTSDTAALVKALEQYRVFLQQPAETQALHSEVERSFGPVDAGAFAWQRLIFGNAVATQARQWTQNSLQSLAALRAVANHMAGMPGRKSLIWLGAGVSINPNGRGAPLPLESRRILAIAGNTGVAIYPVDARGLIGVFDYNPTLAAETPSPLGGASGRNQIPGQKPLDRVFQTHVANTHDNMRLIADLTGGRAFLNNNDIAGGMRAAMDDSRVSYTLSFSPTHNQWDGRYREIRVKLREGSGRGNLEARYRKGYYAAPLESGDSVLRETALANLLQSALPATGIGVRARLVEKRTSGENPISQIQLVLDAHDIIFNPDDQQRWVGDIDLSVEVRDDNDKPLHNLTRSLHLAANKVTYDEYMQFGISVRLNVATPAGTMSARIALRDIVSGLTGSVDLPVR